MLGALIFVGERDDKIKSWAFTPQLDVFARGKRPAKSATTTKERGNVGIRVVVVDDSSLMRQVVKKVIRQTGLDVEEILEANDGREALDIVVKTPVGLILSDINMPRMDGLQMLMQLRQMEEHQDLPVIIVTTEGSDATVEQAMELGATGYVLKPFTPEILAEQLHKIGLMPEVSTDAAPPLDPSDPTAF